MGYLPPAVTAKRLVNLMKYSFCYFFVQRLLSVTFLRFTLLRLQKCTCSERGVLCFGYVNFERVCGKQRRVRNRGRGRD